MLDAALLESLPRFMTPVLLASLAGSICHRAGVFNIALEGMMLVGAFFAVAGSYYSGVGLIGALIAAAVGALLGAAFAYFSVYRKGDEIVVSIGINFLAIGSTVLLLRVLFDTRGQYDNPGIMPVPTIPFPLWDVVLSNQSVLFWSSLALVFALSWFFKSHYLGLRLRAAGENPEALRTAGVSPESVRLLALILSGALCGLAGAQLSISNVTLFTEGMSSGRGWIAVVIVLMCAGRPMLVLPVAFVFGLIDALGFRIQAFGVPQQATDSLPYVIAIVVLAVVMSGRFRSAKRN